MLYGWAKGAEAMHLPAGVGFRVGQGTGSTHLVLQVRLPTSAQSVDTLHPCCLASLIEQDGTVRLAPTLSDSSSGAACCLRMPACSLQLR